ncbi:hypothetical protein CDAR_429551 [Caerostris darwini]|uniref:C2H2-type domain-containing protein n=1 Tax=Caerostris darwini TaxID=1538125 RepID=A0AAV4P9Z6_9ARAC|nr:hypothetical protein CDAR_429551 [Caerostris darwini]
MSLPERLLRAPAGSNVHNQLARGNVGDASNETTADLFDRTSGLRNPICSYMGAEGGQNVVRSSENVQQSAEYSLLQPASNKRNLSNTNDSLTECSVWNKKMRYCEMNPNECSCQPLDLSIRGASFKTNGIRDGEINSCQKTQSSTPASSEEYSSSALSSSKTKDQGKKHVCDIHKKEFSSLSKLEAHMRTPTGEKPFVCNTCQMAFNRSDNLKRHMRIHTGETPYSCEICQRKFAHSSSLKSHKAIHSGISLHCNYCDFETPHKSSLKRHLKRYHSEHKEKCPVCDVYFFSKESLQSHQCKKL